MYQTAPLQRHHHHPSRLSHDEVVELFHLIEAGDIQALETVVIAHRGLVMAGAKRYAWAAEQSSMIDPIDLQQDGYVGLMKAIEKFDLRKGYAFSTLATLWIRSAIGATVYKWVDTLRLPVALNRQRPRVHEVIDKLSARLQRLPTPQEIAMAANVEVEDVEAIMAFDSIKLTSLNQVIDDEAALLVDLIADRHADTPLKCLLQKLVKERVLNLVNELEPMTRMAVLLRCGFEDNREWLVREIADVLGITEDRASKLLHEGFEYLEAHHGVELREFEGFDFGSPDDLSVVTN
jgi:RNA polymerase sigma factor (sigma-70 family)